MRMTCRQEHTPKKPAFLSNISSVKKPISPKQQDDNENQVANEQEDENFSVSIGENRKSRESNMRKIKRSVINRSCINVANYSCRAIPQIPVQLTRNGQMKLGGIQKLDLSFNNIWDIRQLCFSQMSSLKQLILNDNRISELPLAQINSCKGLKLINLTNNQLYIMPALTKISYLEAKGNPLNLITAQLVQLNNLEFFTFDWIDYLIDIQPTQCQDKYNQHSLHYAMFKKSILSKIDYRNQFNINFCDFHCYFMIRFEKILIEDTELNFLGQLIVKAMYKTSTFFINYLKSFHNQINYAKLTYHNKLLLQIIFQNNSPEALQLLCLKKSNYSEDIPDCTYFQSLKLCCSYSNYTMFRYLFEMKKRRKRIQTVSQISSLVHQILYKYNTQKQSDKILFELVSLYIDISGIPISIKIPCQFNSRIFKALSSAMLDIYQHQWLSHYFEVDFNKFRTTPLHFAMKSRNEELLRLLIKQEWDVFQKDQFGVSCKFSSGSTQTSRKMVWRREKALIKTHFKERDMIPIDDMSQKLPRQPRSSINQSIKNRIAYTDMQPSFMIYLAPKQHTKTKYQNIYDSLLASNTKGSLKDEILPNLLVRVKQLYVLNWHQHYLRKMVNIDIITFLLHKISTFMENSLAKRTQMWKRTKECLTEVFQIAGEQNSLIQFQSVQAIEWANLIKQNRLGNQIQVQNQRTSIQNNNFWCCQGVPYQ